MVSKKASDQVGILARSSGPQAPLWTAGDGEHPVGQGLMSGAPLLHWDDADAVPEIRLLSIYQPWASLIALGHKKIETRWKHASYRGWLALHGSKKWDDENAPYARQEPFRTRLREAGYSDPSLLPRGYVVALGRLVDSQRAERLSPEPIERAYGNYKPGNFGWIFDEVLPLATPFKLRGMPGIFSLPIDVQAELWAAAHALPTTHTTTRHTLYTFGYHGQTLEALLAHQARLGALVVDVRFKAPGPPGTGRASGGRRRRWRMGRACPTTTGASGWGTRTTTPMVPCTSPIQRRGSLSSKTSSSRCP
jgi:hypothetical protein